MTTSGLGNLETMKGSISVCTCRTIDNQLSDTVDCDKQIECPRPEKPVNTHA
ncbi:hypothetical protein MHBO_003298, partial [Bonamia ostreae]